MEYVKDFDGWNILKKRLDISNQEIYFYPQEVWWCYVGVNIGSEICGKGELFLRPVLVYKRVSDDIFWAIPLTKTLREDAHHVPFYFDYELHSAIILQMKPLDKSRLFKKIGNLSNYPYKKIKEKAIAFIR